MLRSRIQQNQNQPRFLRNVIECHRTTILLSKSLLALRMFQAAPSPASTSNSPPFWLAIVPKPFFVSAINLTAHHPSNDSHMPKSTYISTYTIISWVHEKSRIPISKCESFCSCFFKKRRQFLSQLVIWVDLPSGKFLSQHSTQCPFQYTGVQIAHSQGSHHKISLVCPVLCPAQHCVQVSVQYILFSDNKRERKEKNSVCKKALYRDFSVNGNRAGTFKLKSTHMPAFPKADSVVVIHHIGLRWFQMFHLEPHMQQMSSSSKTFNKLKPSGKILPNQRAIQENKSLSQLWQTGPHTCWKAACTHGILLVVQHEFPAAHKTDSTQGNVVQSLNFNTIIYMHQVCRTVCF